VKNLVQVTLGVLTAIGGFVDIGDIVASTATGARVGLGLAWVLVVGTVGIMIFAEMAGGSPRFPADRCSTWSASAWERAWRWPTCSPRSSSPC
jgi:hypothetical protein